MEMGAADLHIARMHPLHVGLRHLRPQQRALGLVRLRLQLLLDHAVPVLPRVSGEPSERDLLQLWAARGRACAAFRRQPAQCVCA
jgi:hypothetical protein